MRARAAWGPLRSALLIGGFFAALRFSGCPFIDLVDARAVDFRFLQRGPVAVVGDVVIVAIDDRSLEKIGRWPWPRSTQAELLRVVTAGDPSVVAFDIVQSESTTQVDVAAVLQRLGGLEAETRARLERALAAPSAPEASLASALRESGRSILGYFVDFEFEEVREETFEVDTFSLVRQSTQQLATRVPSARRAVVNLPAIRDAAYGQAFFNVLPDRADGMVRRVPLVIRIGDEHVVPLSLAAARAHLGAPTSMISYADFGVSEVRLGDVLIPTAEDGQLMLNYRGKGKTFQHYSAADLLEGVLEPSVLRGRVVLVGVTATGIADMRVTPFDGFFPGVEIHATAIDNILRRDFVWQPKWLVVSEIAAILVGGLVLGAALGSFRGWWGALTTAALIFAYLAGSQWAFESQGYVFSVLYPLVAFVAIFATANIQHYLAEQRERRRTRGMLELYLSPSMAEFVSERPDRLHLGGERRSMTVLFSDIRGFTAISEQMSPEVLVDCLNVYLGKMTDAVFETGGMLDKYIGDAVMAVWGAPLPSEGHARDAVRTALAMLRALDSFNAEAVQRGWPEIKIGIGINTGEMVFGNMGSEHHMSLTVMGDDVNVAARLEGLTSMYGAPIIVSEATLSAAGEGVRARELDLVKVKGKGRAVRIFEVFEPSSVSSRYLEAYAEGLAAYRDREWRAAEQCFERAIAARTDDPAARLLLSRCSEFEVADPGPDWDGATALTKK